ncbi:hypothetical protein QYF36_013088 [Acer negundo]|nr:hypothetical protein QYF36_013088 [Acer negundo]
MPELQAMRIGRSRRTPNKEVNPFVARETSHNMPSVPTNLILDRNHTNLKLNFPTYVGEGEDPTGWIFKAEQYFEFKNIDSTQQQPKTIFDAIRVAHLIEERNQFQRKPDTYFRPAVPSHQTRTQPSAMVGLFGPLPPQQATRNFNGPV